MSVTPENLFTEASELLDDLIPVLQSSIESLQGDLNPVGSVLQKLLEQEVDRQEALLLRTEDMNDRLLAYINSEEDEPTDDELPEDVLQQVSRQEYPLAVTMPDGERICLKKGSWTLARVIERLGVERVRALGIYSGGTPLVHPRRLRRAPQRKAGRYYIATNTSTATKVEQLQEIANHLKIHLEIEQLNVENEEA